MKDLKICSGFQVFHTYWWFAVDILIIAFLLFDSGNPPISDQDIGRIHAK